MFVGHYAFGLFLKKKFREIPLWTLFIAVQFVDIIAFVLVLLGVERISYRASDNPFLRTSIDYVPFTHSLIGNSVIAGIVFLVFLKLKGRKWGTVLAVAVLAHWFFDLVVHVPDMPLFHGGAKVGLGLWKYPLTAFLFEQGLLILAGYYLLRGAQHIKRHVILIVLLLTGFSVMFFAPEAEATASQASILSISLYSVFAALAYWCDRRWYRASSK